jgi:REP element-mobilizing transposase RayT
MSRGNGRMSIFLDERDYRQFVYVLGDVVEELDIRCWNYCLMPNHYHATLQPSRPNLSDAVRRLNSTYAQWWNRRHGRVGHVFQGRFKDQVVDRDEYLMTLSRYVVMNPVRAGLVERPEEWPWSSYRATIGLSSAPSFLATPCTLHLFGENETRVLQARFAQAVATQTDDPSSIDRIRSEERILGSRTFKEFVQATLQGQTGAQDLPHLSAAEAPESAGK